MPGHECALCADVNERFRQAAPDTEPCGRCGKTKAEHLFDPATGRPWLCPVQPGERVA